MYYYYYYILLLNYYCLLFLLLYIMFIIIIIVIIIVISIIIIIMLLMLMLMLMLKMLIIKAEDHKAGAGDILHIHLMILHRLVPCFITILCHASSLLKSFQQPHAATQNYSNKKNMVEAVVYLQDDHRLTVLDIMLGTTETGMLQPWGEANCRPCDICRSRTFRRLPSGKPFT